MSESRETMDIKPIISGSSFITIKVQMQNKHEVIFRIKRSLQLKELMDAFCLKMGFDVDSIRFHFDGDRIKPYQTPDELEMEDGDEIDAWTEQLGGFVVM